MDITSRRRKIWIRSWIAGVPIEDWEAVFQPYVRVDRVRSRGSGIGLFAARRLMEAMGGRAVDSATNEAVASGAVAGVLAAPVLQASPLMGSNLIVVVFAVVVIGGMGSILGSIVTGLGLGVLEGLTKVFYPELSATVVFIIMAIVLLIRPAGLFGREK